MSPRSGSTSPLSAGRSTGAARPRGLRSATTWMLCCTGSFFRSDHFPAGPRRGSRYFRSRMGSSTWVSRRTTGTEKEDEYTEKRYHQPSDEVLPSFNTMHGAIHSFVSSSVQRWRLRNAPAQPAWNQRLRVPGGGGEEDRSREEREVMGLRPPSRPSAPSYLLRRSDPAPPNPGSDSGPAYRAPDPAHLAAGECRAFHPISYVSRAGPRGLRPP